MARGHFGDVVGSVKVVAFDERVVGVVCYGVADGGFAAAGGTTDDEEGNGL